MYKVFFNDKALFLTDDFSKNFQSKYGLFFKYREKEDLEEIITLYSNLTRIKSLIVFHYNIEELQEVFLSCFKYIEAAGGIVRSEKGEYLMIYRRGKWDLPKGKLDEGETIEAASHRELKEETGLTITRFIKISQPIYSSAGMTDESVAMVYVECQGEPSIEGNVESEEIEIILAAPSDVSKMCKDAELKFDAKAWLVLSSFVDKSKL